MCPSVRMAMHVFRYVGDQQFLCFLLPRLCTIKFFRLQGSTQRQIRQEVRVNMNGALTSMSFCYIHDIPGGALLIPLIGRSYQICFPSVSIPSLCLCYWFSARGHPLRMLDKSAWLCAFVFFLARCSVSHPRLCSRDVLGLGA